MPFKIVRNDITKMNCEAIVNTANDYPTVGTGCDYAIYKAAGYEQLLSYRKEKIGYVEEGGVFLTPGFDLSARYIIHTVSPFYVDGNSGEEEKLRSCYKKSLVMAAERGIHSIAFPLISTGGFGYPQEEGMRIAVDEINAFLLTHEMLIYLVVFGRGATNLGSHIYPDLESYIDENYVKDRRKEEYEEFSYEYGRRIMNRVPVFPESGIKEAEIPEEAVDVDCFDEHKSALEQRMEHLTDTFSEYLLYLIESKGMTNAEVYKRGIVDKKVFSKIKNNPHAHPKKMTAMCLCIGAKLNLDEAVGLLARAGYALSPCDKTDIIFSYFIEKGIYDMIELDIQLEEHGLPCLIS
ncbi:MAG: macro domain-containing protein [Anaerostipes sp.]|nr:macro domain-containing protein [Anaerostipes sp.]